MDTTVLSRPQSGRKRNYFGKEIKALRLFGVSLANNEGTAYKIYSALLVLGTIYVYTFLDTYEYFKQDFNGIADIIIYQVAGCMTICKATVVYLNRVKLENIFNKLEQEPFLANPKRGGSKEKELIEECVWITNVQTYTYWILSGLTITSTIIYGFAKYLITHDHKFPYGPLTIVNTTYSPNYEITYFYQSLSIVYIGCLFSSVDLLLAAVLAHLCYQFKILQNNIERILEICYEDMLEDTNASGLGNVRGLDVASVSTMYHEIDGSIIPWTYLHKTVKKCIEFHLAIIDIATEIEAAFSNLFLIVFLGTLALICFSVFSGSAFGHNFQALARHVGEGVSACLQVAVICYWGEQVIHESQLVATAINESNFVGTDLRYQKMLAFMIRRSQNPTKFTAGKFAVICLATFTWILRTSYSSFMVLRRANEE